MIIVDTGPLYAIADSDDAHHSACTSVLDNISEPLVAPISVVIETCYLIGRYLGPHTEATFLRSLSTSGMALEQLTQNDLDRAADLVSTYADLHLGAVDASVVAIAERLDTHTIFTIDRRHFPVVRPNHTDAFDLLP